MSAMTQLLSSAEAATVLGLDRSTFLEHVRKGRITPAAKAPGSRGAYLFASQDVERLKDERAQKRAAS